eukprot:12635158-Ditylum_brightwellii.AAC.1
METGCGASLPKRPITIRSVVGAASVAPSGAGIPLKSMNILEVMTASDVDVAAASSSAEARNGAAITAVADVMMEVRNVRRCDISLLAFCEFSLLVAFIIIVVDLVGLFIGITNAIEGSKRVIIKSAIKERLHMTEATVVVLSFEAILPSEFCAISQYERKRGKQSSFFFPRLKPT